MSHKSPFRSSTRPASSSPAASTSTGGGGGGVGLSSYKHLHSTLADADSSSDDDIDPRWTHPKVRAAESAKGQREGAPRSAASTHAANFTRTGYVPTASPVETSYLNTSGVTGTTRLDASQVQRAWERGIGTTEGLRNNNATSAIAEEGASDLSASVAGGGRGTDPHTGFYSGIPAPNVNLAGMTEEQRELVEYLQARVDAFERERVDFLQRLDEMSGNSSQKHSLKWDLHKKDEQVMDLQKALSDAHVFLYEERAQVLKLTAENDRLKIQELEDRQRLEHLLALTQPINQEVTYFRECRPEKLSRNYPGARDDIYAGQRDMSVVEAALDSPRRQVLNTSGQAVPISNHSNLSMLSGGNQSQFGNTSMRASTARKAGGAAVSARRAGAGAAAGKGGAAALRPVVRTIYLPNENIDILKQIIASLRSQLTEQHTLFEQRIQALQEDRAIREQETAEVQRKAQAHIQELAGELRAVNELNKMTTRDYLELRHAAQLNERKLKERASVLSQQQVDLAKHLKDVEGKAARNETDLATENAQYVSLFRQQTAATEEDLAIMKAQYAATQDLYEKRIRYLEGRIATLKQKVRTVEDRRSLELEGYTTDISKLRQKLRKLEHTLVGLKVGLVQDDAAAAATTSSASSTERESVASSPHKHGHGAHSHRGGGGATAAKKGGAPSSGGGNTARGLAPAKIALMDDDVEQLQQELSTLARRIGST